MSILPKTLTPVVLLGDVVRQLQRIPSNSIDLAITSPPYWGQRDYGVKGQIGVEETPDEYIEKLLSVFTELRRVLKDTGSFFLNIGDKYVGKDLQMIPYKLAIKMQENGWALRNIIIWHKTNAMPSCLSPDTEIYLKGEDDIIYILTLKDLTNLDIKKFQILTPLGWKNIKNIWKVKKEEYLEFQFGSSGTVACSLDHRFPVSHDNRRKNYRIELAKNLKEDEHRSLNRLLFVPIGEFLEGKYKKNRRSKIRL